jgi:hypothetical protein
MSSHARRPLNCDDAECGQRSRVLSLAKHGYKCRHSCLSRISWPGRQTKPGTRCPASQFFCAQDAHDLLFWSLLDLVRETFVVVSGWPTQCPQIPKAASSCNLRLAASTAEKPNREDLPPPASAAEIISSRRASTYEQRAFGHRRSRDQVKLPVPSCQAPVAWP